MGIAVSLELLTTALLDLAYELRTLPDPFLVGGGFGLYLKQRHLEEQPAQQTLIPAELWPPARATEDIDLILPTKIIVSAESMRRIRAAFDRLGYRREVSNFHFVKVTDRGPMKVDLLTCDIPAEHADKVKIKMPRVRPLGDIGLHAYLTKEAIALELAPFEMTIRGMRSGGTPAVLRVRIPNPFTYLLMKLHAFRDRKDDERKILGEHHALDVYRIAAMLSSAEFDLVQRLFREHRESVPVKEAVRIVRDLFGSPSSIGVLRLVAAVRRTGIELETAQRAEFVSSLRDLFPETPS